MLEFPYFLLSLAVRRHPNDSSSGYGDRDSLAEVITLPDDVQDPPYPLEESEGCCLTATFKRKLGYSNILQNNSSDNVNTHIHSKSH